MSDATPIPASVFGITNSNLRNAVQTATLMSNTGTAARTQAQEEDTLEQLRRLMNGSMLSQAAALAKETLTTRNSVTDTKLMNRVLIKFRALTELLAKVQKLVLPEIVAEKPNPQEPVPNNSDPASAPEIEIGGDTDDDGLPKYDGQGHGG